MYRCLSVCLVLVFMAMGQVSAGAKSALITPATTKKLPSTTAPSAGSDEAPSFAVPQRLHNVVRIQSIVTPKEADFNAPEGALYTTSDECA